MKVMFEPAIGATMSFGCKNRVAKQAGNELPVRREGYSNEEIYNAIMSVKNKFTRVFTRETNKSLDTVG